MTDDPIAPELLASVTGGQVMPLPSPPGVPTVPSQLPAPPGVPKLPSRLPGGTQGPRSPAGLPPELGCTTKFSACWFEQMRPRWFM